MTCPNEACKQNHAPAESRTLTNTAFYSPDFARRVVYRMNWDSTYSPEIGNNMGSLKKAEAKQYGPGTNGNPSEDNSPYRWMLGRFPDSDRTFAPGVERLPGSLLHHPESGPAHAEAMVSEKALSTMQRSSQGPGIRSKDCNSYLLRI